MQLALLWSIDPTTLDEAYKEPAMGLLGRVPWARAEPSTAFSLAPERNL